MRIKGISQKLIDDLKQGLVEFERKQLKDPVDDLKKQLEALESAQLDEASKEDQKTALEEKLADAQEALDEFDAKQSQDSTAENGAKPPAPQPQSPATLDPSKMVTFKRGGPPKAARFTVEPIKIDNVPSLETPKLDAGAKKLDSFDDWKKQITQHAIAAVLNAVKNTRADIEEAKGDAKQAFIEELEAEQPGGVFYRVFNWAALNEPSEQDKKNIVKFLAHVYQLDQSQIRADENGVCVTPIEFLEDGRIRDNHNQWSIKPIKLSNEEIQKDDLLADLKWADGNSAGKRIFAPKFSREENNEYHIAYATAVLEQLTKPFPHAPVMIQAIKNEEFGQSIIDFKVTEEGFKFGFNSKPKTPEVITSTLEVTQEKYVASNAEDVALDAAIASIKLEMDLPGEKWKYGVNINSDDTDNFLKSVAAFQEEGIGLDDETKAHLKSLTTDEDNNTKYNKARQDYVQRKNAKKPDDSATPPVPPENNGGSAPPTPPAPGV